MPITTGGSASSNSTSAITDITGNAETVLNDNNINLTGEGKEKPSDNLRVVNFSTDGINQGTEIDVNITNGQSKTYDITNILDKDVVLSGFAIRCRTGGTGTICEVHLLEDGVNKGFIAFIPNLGSVMAYVGKEFDNPTQLVSGKNYQVVIKSFGAHKTVISEISTITINGNIATNMVMIESKVNTTMIADGKDNWDILAKLTKINESIVKISDNTPALVNGWSCSQVISPILEANTCVIVFEALEDTDIIINTTSFSPLDVDNVDANVYLKKVKLGDVINTNAMTEITPVKKYSSLSAPLSTVKYAPDHNPLTVGELLYSRHIQGDIDKKVVEIIPIDGKFPIAKGEQLIIEIYNNIGGGNRKMEYSFNSNLN